MTSKDQLIADAKAAVADEEALDAADLAIEEALRGGWDAALVQQLINDFNRRFRNGDRLDRIVRHAALATAVGYGDVTATTRAFYVEGAVWPGPDGTPTPGEFWSAHFARRVASDALDSWTDLGGGLMRRRMLMDDEGAVDARAMLDAADRLLEAAHPDSAEQFRLLVDRAHALLILSDGGARAGAFAAARRTLARAKRVHDGRDAQTRGGHRRLELMLLQSHASLGGHALTPQETASALLQSFDDAIAAGEELQPVVEESWRHIQAFSRTSEITTRAHTGLLRRLVGVELPAHIHGFFLSHLAANLWGRLANEQSPVLGEEALAIGRELFRQGTLDAPTLAAAMLRSAQFLVDPQRIRQLLAEAAALQQDPLSHEADLLRGFALARLAETGGGAAPAFEAIQVAVVCARDHPQGRRTALALRARAVRALIDLGDGAAFAELEQLLREPDGESIVDLTIVVAADTEAALSKGVIAPAAAASYLYRCGAARGFETAPVSVIPLLRTPAGAAFPHLRDAARDIPAFAAAVSDALPDAVWSAPVAGILADFAEGSPFAEQTEQRAITILEAAVAAGDDAPDAEQSRWQLAARLLTRFDRERAGAENVDLADPLSWADLRRAIDLLIPDQEKRKDLAAGMRRRLLTSLEFRMSFGSELDKLRRMLLQDAVYDEEDLLPHRLRAASAFQHLWAGLFWGVVWGPFGPLADALERELDQARPEVLERAQGLASRSAYAAVGAGRFLLAVEIAERGQGLLAARALQRLGRPESGLHVDHGRLHGAWNDASTRLRRAVESSLPMLDDLKATALSRPPTRRLERDEALSELARTSPRLAELIAEEERTRSDLEAAAGFVVPDPDITAIVTHLHRRSAQLSYLIATGWGGTAVTVRRDGSIAVSDLPGLTDEACARWQVTLAESAPGGVLRDAVVRGPESQPDLADVDLVLAELAEALRPLADELARHDDAVELVPTGSTAVLPLTAALQSTRDDDGWFEISTAASARLHIAAESRSNLLVGASGVVAITDPSAVTAGTGRALPSLAYAKREGARLAERYGGTHYTGSEATGMLARVALRERQRVLHFAVHGESDADDPSASRVYLAGGSAGHVDALTAAEMSSEVIATRLVYLGACWTGRPGARLPDEAIGFPTLLVQSGAGGVIAPLWPVEDGASFTFAGVFYRSWIDEGRSTARALADAMRATRQRHPSTPTWAAFSLYGT